MLCWELRLSFYVLNAIVFLPFFSSFSFFTNHLLSFFALDVYIITVFSIVVCTCLNIIDFFNTLSLSFAIPHNFTGIDISSLYSSYQDLPHYTLFQCVGHSISNFINLLSLFPVQSRHILAAFFREQMS